MIDRKEKKEANRLNIGSMSEETKRALARFEAITGLRPVRFISNRHSMQPWFSIWVRKDDPGVASAIREYAYPDGNGGDVNTLNGLRYDFLIDDEVDGTVRFDVDRERLL